MIKYLSLFSGIGAFEKALENLGVEFDLVNYCENDKYASKAYSLIHNQPESKNLGDITTIDIEQLPQVDLITYGFPCQDISSAGKQKGSFNKDGTPTRSGLFFNALDIIEHCQPKVAIAENVKNLVSKKFQKQFKIILDGLDDAGYNNYYTLLKSTDYGIPQRRERVFIVSIRKDVDDGSFKFPATISLDKSLVDLLEDQVDNKHYLSPKGMALVKKHEPTRVDARTYPSNLSLINLAHGDNPGREYDVDIFPTLSTGTCTHWHTLLKEETENGEIKIRKLSPKEAFRLQGFEDKDVDICSQNKVSDYQLYRQAGNSITVNVIQALFSMLIDDQKQLRF